MTNATRTLTPQEEAFAVAMADPTCRGLTDAYARAGYSQAMTPRARNSEAWEIANRPHVALRIAELRTAAAARVIDGAADVLAEWVAIATADASELSHIRVFNCRHCYGQGFAFQWIDDAEFARACAEVIDANERARIHASARRGVPLPPDKAMRDYSGGVGYTRNREPNPDCPHCWGDGERFEFFADTTKLSARARKLFAGVKRTRDGIEIKTRDQDAALSSIAKYLGMLVDRHAHGGDPRNPTPIPVAAAVAELPAQEAALLYQQFIAGK
jgi:phage terminase small subunit